MPLVKQQETARPVVILLPALGDIVCNYTVDIYELCRKRHDIYHNADKHNGKKAHGVHSQLSHFTEY